MALIYKLKCGNFNYVGSTINSLEKRLRDHKYNPTNGSRKLFETNGEVEIELLEECDETNRYIRERYWYENTSNCVNINIPAGTKKEADKRYRESHADKIRQNKRRKVTCSCGAVVSYGALSLHYKTKKHLTTLVC